MQGLYDGLRGLNIADKRIHAEAFGPASLARTLDADSADLKIRAPATAPVPIAFTASGKEARWTPESGSLLELAESRGLQPAFSCRGGSCGSCRTRIVEGQVAYKTRPSFKVGEDEALICCAVPAAPEDGGGPRLQLEL
jgi:ferredoxin